jgi:hypothetical protein
MITELEFVKGETRESALQKLAAWYDDQQHQAVIKFARDIEGAALSKQHKSDALEYACRSPSKGGRRFWRTSRGCPTRSSPWVGRSRWPSASQPRDGCGRRGRVVRIA